MSSILIATGSAVVKDQLKVILTRLRLANPVHWVDSGQALSEVLWPAEEHRALAPQLILMSMEIPGVDPRQVLLKLRNDKALARTGVVLLSASPMSREQRLRLQADACLQTPVTLEGVCAALRDTGRFALGLVRMKGD